MKTIHAMQHLFKILTDFETTFENIHQISFNEAMALYTLKGQRTRMTATQLASQTHRSPSHTSKILRLLEEKGLIVRTLDTKDRRRMYFHLSQAGQERISELEEKQIEMPDILKCIIENIPPEAYTYHSKH